MNGKTFKSSIHRKGVISLFGREFSRTGNVVSLKQGARFLRVAAGSPWWHETPTQINLSLPVDLAPGKDVVIYVTRADGRDSNGQVVEVLP